MTHIEIPEWLHRDLELLKPVARKWWETHYHKRKGRVSMEEVIYYLTLNRKY